MKKYHDDIEVFKRQIKVSYWMMIYKMNTIKLVIAVSIVLFSVGLFSHSVINAYGQTAFSQVRDGFQLYNNTEYGFQILYPQDWNVVEGDAELGDYITNIVTFEPLGEEGKHHSGKFICGEVCLAIWTDHTMLIESTPQVYLDEVNNGLKAQKGDYKLIEYNLASKLGNKKAFEMLFEIEQGNRDYIQRILGIPYPDSDAYESKNFFTVTSKIRDKYTDEMLPLSNTMLNSFRFTENTNTTMIDSFKFTENTNTDFPKTRALCDTVTTQSEKDLCETLLN